MSSTTAKPSDARFTVSSVFNALVFGGGFGLLCTGLALGLWVRDGALVAPLIALAVLGWGWAAHRRVLVVDDRRQRLELQWRFFGVALRRRAAPFSELLGVRVYLSTWMGRRWQRNAATNTYEARDTGRRWSYRVLICARGFSEEVFYSRGGAQASERGEALARRLGTTFVDHDEEVSWETPPCRIGVPLVVLILGLIVGLGLYGHLNRAADRGGKTAAAATAQQLSPTPDVDAERALRPGEPIMVFHGALFYPATVVAPSSSGPVPVRFEDGFGRKQEYAADRERLRLPRSDAQ